MCEDIIMLHDVRRAELKISSGSKLLHGVNETVAF